MIDVVKKVEDMKESQITSYPARANYASNIGHPCLRFLVYNRLNWQDKKKIPLSRKFIFDEGNNQEKQVLKDLAEAGVDVIQQQTPFTWEQYQISGRIDGMIKEGGEKIPMEIKSMSPYSFDAINSEGDMYTSKYWYIKNYLAQMTLYLLMIEKNEGLFILKNKTTGRLKQIAYPLVYELGESLLKKAVLINKHVSENTYPDRMDYDERICPDCDFCHICTPGIVDSQTELIVDDEFIALINRRAALKLEVSPRKKELEDIEETIKKAVEGKEKVVAGDYLLKWKISQRKGYVVADAEVKQLQYIKVGGEK